MKQKWFGVHRFWGWYPKTWQGYLVIATMFAAIIYIMIAADALSHSVSDTLILAFPSICLIITVAMWVTLLTGQRPEFGAKNKDSKSYSPDDPRAYLLLAFFALPLALFYLVNKGYIGTFIFLIISYLIYKIYLKLKSFH